ncbi:TonB-dependent receptor [Akkermansiaceae bacterium]|nr:TonB-dependent receptor [Akkermansiaceae bacterium]
MTKHIGIFSLTSALAVGMLTAQDAIETLETVNVIGSTDDLLGLTGAGAFLEAGDFQKKGLTNIQQILRKVPGVYVREEDGFGNFPNISLRGGDGTRSEKVTIMEDGILTAPAPYSAPAAYYSPRAGRMSGIEVLKGSSQIQYGPQTTGGVINFLSTEIPTEETFYTRNTYGTFNTLLSHSYYGDTVETKVGTFGFLLELFHHSSDGFRDIDAGGGLPRSSNTGFTLTEPMIKLFWEPNTPVRQRLEFKYGFSDFDSDESYIGLTENDVRNSPDRRYAGTRFDNMASEQHRTYLKYRVEPTANLNLEIAGYYNEFSRNWAKVDDIVGGANSVRGALATGNGLDILQMRGPGTLVYRNNNRDYSAYGYQIQGDYTFATGNVDHLLKFGARYHRDDVRRFQNDEQIVLGATGAITNRIVGAPGSQGNRFQETDALAIWVQDEIEIGNLTVTPGLRYEHIDQFFRDFNANQSGANTFDLFSPGVGFNYELDNSAVVYGGVYRGISTPGPRSASRNGVEEEESIGYELGYRYQSPKMSYDFAAFFTDFDNLIATDAGLGVLDNSQNVGEAEVFGLEAQISYDPLAGSGSELSLPMYISATWTDATLTSAVTGGGSDNIYAGATDGSEIPYVPEWQVAAGIGLAKGDWSLNLDATFVSDAFGTAQNVDSPSQDTTGAGARAGKIDELLLFDLTGTYDLSENVTLLAGVSNLFDERGITSRLARGPRANIGRNAFVGFEAKF